MGKLKTALLMMNWVCLIGIISTVTLIESMTGFVVYSLGYIISLYILTDGGSPQN